MLLWWFFSIIVCIKANHICSGVDEEFSYDRFSTKTGYFAAYKDDQYVEQYESEVSQCTPVQFWLLSRHGTRYPVKSESVKLPKTLLKLSNAIVGNHHQGRGCLDEETVKKFENWFPIYSQRDAEQLQETGHEELYSIGENYKEKFPELLDQKYNSSEFKIEFTIMNRTGQSAYHFLRGVFGDDEVGKIELPQPHSPNFLLRFYESCPRWLKEVYDNNMTYIERDLFQKSEDFSYVIHAVSARLGFMHPLQPEELLAIYQECRYEMAWLPHITSPWCLPFSQRDIEILEYLEDLKYYYRDSYGSDMNAQIACRTLSDLYLNFRSTIKTKIGLPKGIFYFSHDKALIKVLAAFGLFKPRQKLLHSNFEQMKKRKFRTSVMSSFANNIAFTVFKCGKSYRVGTFFNELPIIVEDICSDKILCSWSDFKKFLSPIYENCDLADLCMIHDEL